MPVVYKCKVCGYVFYNFKEVGQDFYGVRTPTEIKIIYGGKCPRCGHVITTKPNIDDISIRLRKSPLL